MLVLDKEQLKKRGIETKEDSEEFIRNFTQYFLDQANAKIKEVNEINYTPLEVKVRFVKDIEDKHDFERELKQLLEKKDKIFAYETKIKNIDVNTLDNMFDDADPDEQEVILNRIEMILDKSESEEKTVMISDLECKIKNVRETISHCIGENNISPAYYSKGAITFKEREFNEEKINIDSIAHECLHALRHIFQQDNFCGYATYKQKFANRYVENIFIATPELIEFFSKQSTIVLKDILNSENTPEKYKSLLKMIENDEDLSISGVHKFKKYYADIDSIKNITLSPMIKLCSVLEEFIRGDDEEIAVKLRYAKLPKYIIDKNIIQLIGESNNNFMMEFFTVTQYASLFNVYEKVKNILLDTNHNLRSIRSAINTLSDEQKESKLKVGTKYNNIKYYFLNIKHKLDLRNKPINKNSSIFYHYGDLLNEIKNENFSVPEELSDKKPYTLSKLVINENRSDLEKNWAKVITLPAEEVDAKYIQPIRAQVEEIVNSS